MGPGLEQGRESLAWFVDPTDEGDDRHPRIVGPGRGIGISGDGDTVGDLHAVAPEVFHDGAPAAGETAILALSFSSPGVSSGSKSTSSLERVLEVWKVATIGPRAA